MVVNKRLEELKWISAVRPLTREEAWWLIEQAGKSFRQEAFIKETSEHFESLGTNFVSAKNTAMAFEDFLSDEKSFVEE